MSDAWKKKREIQILWPQSKHLMLRACPAWVQQYLDLNGRVDGVSHPFLHHQKPEEIFK